MLSSHKSMKFFSPDVFPGYPHFPHLAPGPPMLHIQRKFAKKRRRINKIECICGIILAFLYGFSFFELFHIIHRVIHTFGGKSP